MEKNIHLCSWRVTSSNQHTNRYPSSRGSSILHPVNAEDQGIDNVLMALQIKQEQYPANGYGMFDS